MSRYKLVPFSERYEVSIGWDRPLANFFLTVHDSEIDEEQADPIILWLGADRRASETDVDRVLREAERWAAIPWYLRAFLLLDQRLE